MSRFANPAPAYLDAYIIRGIKACAPFSTLVQPFRFEAVCQVLWADSDSDPARIVVILESRFFRWWSVSITDRRGSVGFGCLRKIEFL